MKFKSETLIQMAALVAKESKSVKYKVGCIIEKDSNIIASGCNGTTTGADNCCQVAQSNQWDMSGK